MKKWIILILVLLGLDQGSKIWVSSTMQYRESIPLIEDFFHLTYTRNTGILFGGLPGTSENYWWVFIVFAIIALGVFSTLLFKSDFSDKRMFIYRLGLSLLIAGSLGNAIDRLVQVDHAVIDFLDFNGIWAYIFNFADTFLNVGIFLFFVDTFFLEKKRVVKNG